MLNILCVDVLNFYLLACFEVPLSVFPYLSLLECHSQLVGGNTVMQRLQTVEF
jgi:hypothetical protein